MAAVAVLVVPAMWVLGASSWDLNTALAIGQHVRLYDLLEDALPGLLLASILAAGLLSTIQDATSANGLARLVRWTLVAFTGVVFVGVGLVSGRLAFLVSFLAVATGIGLTRQLWLERPRLRAARMTIAAVLVVGGYVASGVTSAVFPFVDLRVQGAAGAEHHTGVRLVAVEGERAWILEDGDLGMPRLVLVPGTVISVISCSSLDAASCEAKDT